MQDSLHYRLLSCQASCNRKIVGHLKENTTLRPGEPKILEFLAEHEPCVQKDIAHGCELDPASVTGILGRMEERGLIKRESLNGNRRSLFVSMTEKGREMELKVEEIFLKVDNEACAGLSDEQRTQLSELLDIVYKNLKESGDKNAK